MLVLSVRPSHPYSLFALVNSAFLASFDTREVILEARRVLLFANRKQPIAASAIQRAEQEVTNEMLIQMVRISNALAFHSALAAKHKELIALMIERRIAVSHTGNNPTPSVLVLILHTIH